MSFSLPSTIIRTTPISSSESYDSFELESDFSHSEEESFEQIDLDEVRKDLNELSYIKFIEKHTASIVGRILNFEEDMNHLKRSFLIHLESKKVSLANHILKYTEVFLIYKVTDKDINTIAKRRFAAIKEVNANIDDQRALDFYKNLYGEEDLQFLDVKV